MQRQMRVIQGTAAEARPRSGIESAYDHFRLERQGELVSQSTLEHYDYMVQPFLDWLRREQPDVRRFEDLDVAVVRAYRAVLAAGRRRDGRQLAAVPPATGRQDRSIGSNHRNVEVLEAPHLRLLRRSQSRKGWTM